MINWPLNYQSFNPFPVFNPFLIGRSELILPHAQKDQQQPGIDSSSEENHAHNVDLGPRKPALIITVVRVSQICNMTKV